MARLAVRFGLLAVAAWLCAAVPAGAGRGSTAAGGKYVVDTFVGTAKLTWSSEEFGPGGAPSEGTSTAVFRLSAGRQPVSTIRLKGSDVIKLRLKFKYVDSATRSSGNPPQQEPPCAYTLTNALTFSIFLRRVGNSIRVYYPHLIPAGLGCRPFDISDKYVPHHSVPLREFEQHENPAWGRIGAGTRIEGTATTDILSVKWTLVWQAVVGLEKV